MEHKRKREDGGDADDEIKQQMPALKKQRQFRRFISAFSDGGCADWHNHFVERPDHKDADDNLDKIERLIDRRLDKADSRDIEDVTMDDELIPEDAVDAICKYTPGECNRVSIKCSKWVCTPQTGLTDAKGRRKRLPNCADEGLNALWDAIGYQEVLKGTEQQVGTAKTGTASISSTDVTASSTADQAATAAASSESAAAGADSSSALAAVST
jgi:hypothetical protein